MAVARLAWLAVWCGLVTCCCMFSALAEDEVRGGQAAVEADDTQVRTVSQRLLAEAVALSQRQAQFLMDGDDDLCRNATALQDLAASASQCQLGYAPAELFASELEAASAAWESHERESTEGEDQEGETLSEVDLAAWKERKERNRARHLVQSELAMCAGLSLRVARMQRRAALLERQRHHAGAADVDDSAHEMLRVPLAKTRRQDFAPVFQEVMAAAQPAVLTRAPDDTHPPLFPVDDDAVVQDIATAWRARFRERDRPAVQRWHACCPHAERLVLPALAWNDFTPRMQAVATSKQHRMNHPHDARHARSALGRWPRLWMVSPDHVVPFHSPPNALNCLLIPLQHAIHVVAYAPQHAAALDWRLNGTFSPPHPFGDYADAIPPHARSTIVRAGDAVFVPGEAVVSWRAALDDALDSSDDTLVAQFCFLDASNINAVRRALTTGAYADAEHAGLLRLLQSQALHTDMERLPVELSLEGHRKWPREAPKAAEEDDAAPSDSGDDASMSAAAKRAAKRRRRRRGRSGRLKAWQVEKRWRRKIQLLALPAPSQTSGEVLGRTAVKVAFTCPLIGQDGHRHDGKTHDSEAHSIEGYVIAWSATCVGCDSLAQGLEAHGVQDDGEDQDVPSTLESMAQAVSHATAPAGDGGSAGRSDGGTDAAASREELAATLTSSLVGFHVHGAAAFRFGGDQQAIAVNCDDREDRLCINVTHLQPGHAYSFRVAALTTDGATTFSEASSPVVTTAVLPPSPVHDVAVTVASAASVMLRWEPPHDDGGMPVIGHVVARGSQAIPDASDVVIVGPAPVVGVGGLVPGTSYVFKVAAVSAAGIGPFSEPTQPVVMPDKQQSGIVPTLFGYDPRVVEQQPGGTHLGTEDEELQAELAEDAAAGEEVHEEWQLEDRLVSAAFAVVMRHAQELHLPPEVLQASPPPSPSVPRPGAVSRPPPRRTRGPRLPPPSKLGRQHHGIAYFAGSAPSSAFAVLSDGTVVAAKSESLAHPLPLPVMMPCFGPPATVSDSSRLVKLPNGVEFTGWPSHWSPLTYDVHAELIAASPITGGMDLHNAPLLKNRVVYMDRGSVSLRDKAAGAAAAGALAIVVGDTTGRCETFTQMCVAGSDATHGEGFASTDRPVFWKHARIPYLLVSDTAAAAIRKALAL